MDKLHNFLASVTGQEKVGFIDYSQTSLYVAAAAIAFNPIFWNIVARQEYRTHFLTKIFGSPYYGCYALALTIFGLGIFRDSLYKTALEEQPLYPPLLQPTLGVLLFCTGNVLVLSSMWALGITGTYLGDYFGILMDDIVTGFPLNVTASPMYYGSTMNFLGTAILFGKPAGILLTAEVLIVYLIALRFEDPFTSAIYAKREKAQSKSGLKKAKKEL